MYIFYAVVVDANFVAADAQRWNELAHRVWRRNALRQIVSFSFGDKDRLIGVVKQPISTIYDLELVLYVDTLARECDRFRYVLTGEGYG